LGAAVSVTGKETRRRTRKSGVVALDGSECNTTSWKGIDQEGKGQLQQCDLRKDDYGRVDYGAMSRKTRPQTRTGEGRIRCTARGPTSKREKKKRGYEEETKGLHLKGKK